MTLIIFSSIRHSHSNYLFYFAHPLFPPFFWHLADHGSTAFGTLEPYRGTKVWHFLVKSPFYAKHHVELLQGTYTWILICLREREQVETNSGGRTTDVGRSAGDLKVLMSQMVRTSQDMLKHKRFAR